MTDPRIGRVVTIGDTYAAANYYRRMIGRKGVLTDILLKGKSNDTLDFTITNSDTFVVTIDSTDWYIDERDVLYVDGPNEFFVRHLGTGM